MPDAAGESRGAITRKPIWIGQREIEGVGIEPTLQPAASDHLALAKRALDRIDAGIDLLISDPEPRLAFCFANQAMNLQARWAGRDRLVRRPFHLAFILMNLPAVVDPHHRDRGVCDLLWFPTGGGETEACLGLAAFSLAWRRRVGVADPDDPSDGGGLGVLSRYTLRLLTIQQFRRALGMITACEFLRVAGAGSGDRFGWLPPGATSQDRFVWGSMRFSIGLWMGSGVTPNSLHTITFKAPTGRPETICGALDIFGGKQGCESAAGDPALVTACPACRARLAVSHDGLPRGRHRLHFVVTGSSTAGPHPIDLPEIPAITVLGAEIAPVIVTIVSTVTIDFSVNGKPVTYRTIDRLWDRVIEPAVRVVAGDDLRLECFRPARPGCFLRTIPKAGRAEGDCDFGIWCPNPDCDLNQRPSMELTPIPSGTLADSACNHWQPQTPLLCLAFAGHPDRSARTPVPALTINDQIYHRAPSMVVATGDKFARLPFEPDAALLFGAVDRDHARWGFCRRGFPPSRSGLSARGALSRDIPPFRPTDLILQDELHLIEGSLGSKLGIYETVIDQLIHDRDPGRGLVNYIALTATVRQAADQMMSLFAWELAQ